MKKYIIILLALTTITTACRKKPREAGKGGSATVNVYPQHHGDASKLITFKVYIKYNVSDAPANGQYDDSMSCINRDSLVTCSFTGLKNGNYYLYGRGYDTAYEQEVRGGIPYSITAQSAQDMVLSVSE